MQMAIDLLSRALLAGGGFFCIVGALGLLRMPDFFTRMHAASVIETLGAGMLLAGMMLQAGLSLVTVRLLIIGLLLFFACPTAAHALGRAALARGLRPQLGATGEEPSKP